MKAFIHSIFILLAIAGTALPVWPQGMQAGTTQVRNLLRQSQEILKQNPIKAEEWATRALTLAGQAGDSTSRAEAHIALGNCLLQQRRYTAAIEQYDKAKITALQLKDEAQLARLLKFTADAYAGRTYFRQAADRYLEAIPLLRKTGQTVLLKEGLNAMGRITMIFGRPKNAIGLYQRVLSICKTLNDADGMIAVNGKLSAAYLETKQYDSALYYNHQVQKQSARHQAVMMEALCNEAIIYCFLNRILEAAAAVKKAETGLTAESSNDEKIRIGTAATVYYMTVGDKEKTKLMFDSVAGMMTGTQNPEAAIAGLGWLAEISHIKGNDKTAFDLIKLSERYKDSYRNDHIDRMRAETETASEITLREKEIEYLNLGNRLKAEQLSKDELQRMALLREGALKDSSLASQQLMMSALESESALRREQLKKEQELSRSLARENELKQQLLNDGRRSRRLLLAGIGALVLLGGIIFFQYRRQRRKNSLIKKQSAELQVLNKEIHHRVKNNLQVISSMLGLQTQSVKDSKATAILKESIQRIQSMAFIHQNLYQGHSANSVNMGEYINMLSNHLFQTYNIRPETIQLHTEIEELRLHTDTAIPLGMILNELISNALKYAFRGRGGGQIWVTMKKKQHELLLRVKDNGLGLPAKFNADSSGSFGYEIIRAFAQKLRARINIDGNNGTDVQLIILKFKTTA